MNVSKGKIDKSGYVLSGKASVPFEDRENFEAIFDEYRKSHLQPLSEFTIELQQWLRAYGIKYYIAQRLKRKPQIIRKLNRLSVRLTQLQDIGGCRIIVEENSDVDSLHSYILEKVSAEKNFKIVRTTDYREKGRDDSGYRALHLILIKGGSCLELQIRSKIQHYWAESIERTSVIYGYHLKEQEGDKRVILYFKKLSDIFWEIEVGRQPDSRQKLELEGLLHESEKIVMSSDKNKVLQSYTDENIIRTLIEKEKRNPAGLNNWIIVFDWNQGSFISWDIVGMNPDQAISKYIEHENLFPASEGFEVVMIGSSDVATVRQTHSHYFGIDTFDHIIEGLEQSLIGIGKKMDIDIGARQIISVLHRRKYWGNKSISPDTLKNHFCKGVITFESSLRRLIENGLVEAGRNQAGISLNISMKEKIEGYL